ncbi:Phytochelatin synthase-domain-containing protein [Gorgonomyces haynaldii]|nr:Phytochelatin synthase-domain-containing protein [Gorgonomyces haynaldii]
MLWRRFTFTEAKDTFYRRALPSVLHSFTSPTGRDMFRNALDSGHSEIYFQLAGNFTMQSEPSFCGLGSLTMVLNALSVDPGRKWKGVWRWYADDMLECCKPLEQVKEQGLTFDQVASTARCNGLNVVAKRADHTPYEEFLQDIANSTKTNDTHIVVSFSRQMLQQTGDGHFSPIAAFDPISKSILVLDTARFKYPSYFVDAKLLYDAMKPIDKVTGLSRGYMILSRGNIQPLALSRIVIPKQEWDNIQELFDKMYQSFPQPPTTLQQIVDSLLPLLINDTFYTQFSTRAQDLAGSTKVDIQSAIERLIHESKQHKVYELVEKTWEKHQYPKDDALMAKAVLLLLSLPAEIVSRNRTDCAHLFSEYQNVRHFYGLHLLKDEVARLAFQWNSLANVHCSCKHHL